MTISQVTYQLNCTPGNKQCGGRCVPNWYNCNDASEIKQNKDLDEIRNDKSKNPGNAVGIQQRGNIFSTILNFIPDLFNDLHNTHVGTSYEAERFHVGDRNAPELKERYAKFEPGDIISKSYIDTKSGTRVNHFGIYVGTDSKTGDPQVVENVQSVTGENKEKKVKQVVKIRSLYNYQKDLTPTTVETSWTKVESPVLPREQVVRRSLAAVGKIHNYHLLDSNCEHLARMLANNDYYSTAANLRNNVVSSIIRRLNPQSNTNHIGLTAPKLIAEVDKAIDKKKVNVTRKITNLSRRLIFSQDNWNNQRFTEKIQTFNEYISQNYNTLFFDFQEFSDYVSLSSDEEENFLDSPNIKMLSKKFSSSSGLLPLDRVLQNLQGMGLDKAGLGGRALIEAILKYYLIMLSVAHNNGEMDDDDPQVLQTEENYESL